MNKTLFLILLLTSLSAYSNVNVDIELNLNGKVFTLNAKDVVYEKNNSINKDDYRIDYKISTEIPAEITNSPSNDLVHFTIKAHKGEKTLGDGSIVAAFDSEASLETEDETGFFKVNFVASRFNVNKLKELSNLLDKARAIKIKSPSEKTQSELFKKLEVTGTVKEVKAQ